MKTAQNPKQPGTSDQHPGAVYLPMDVRQSLAHNMELPRHTEGAALFADISGFTSLAETLTRSLGRRRGAEELPIMLNRVYDAVIAEVDRYGGSVVGFAGDSITCWFDAHIQDIFDMRPSTASGASAGSLRSIFPVAYAAARAAACALEIQKAMQAFANVHFPGMENASLAIKVAVASGPARRMRVGNPDIQRIETLAGETLSRMAVGESLTKRGEIVIDERTADLIGPLLRLGEWRTPEPSEPAVPTGPVSAATPVSSRPVLSAGERFVTLLGLEVEVPIMPWPELPSGSLDARIIRSWVQPPVFERLEAGLGEFLTELRPAASLFLRFSGLDYDRDPAAGQKLDTFIRRVQGIALRYGGIFLQLTIGEKGSYLYIAFGAPVAQEDAPRAAAEAALELRSLPLEFTFIKNVQIGLSLGAMRTGAYGGRTRRTYGVLGDQVNLAARLMLMTEPGRILASQGMQNAVPDFAWQPLPPVNVKGKTTPVPVCRLLGREDQRSVHDLGTFGSAWVGREDELARLRRQAARSILLSGVAGMGKTRLAQEALHPSQFAAAEGAKGVLPRMLSGGPVELQNRTPYRAWRPVLTQLFGGSAWENARTWMIRCLPQRLDHLGLLEDVLSFGNPPAAPNYNDPAARKAALFELLEQILQAAALEDPARPGLVIFLDNVQAMDSLSWELVRRIAQAENGQPIHLLLAARSEAAQELPFHEELRVELAPLSRAESAALAASLLGLPAGTPMPEALTTLLERRAAGNPFFIIQITLHLVEQGFLKVQDGQPLLSGKPAEIEQILPDTIQGLLLARIDRLGPQNQLVLKVASIIGQTFNLEILRHLLKVHTNGNGAPVKLGIRELRAELQELCQRGLLASSGANEYRFESLLGRETAYQTLPFAQRRKLHARLAHWLESSHRTSQADPALLAQHWELAEEPQRALPYLLLAGEAARSLYALPEAIRFFTRALEILRAAGDDAQTARTLMKLGLTYHLTFDFEAARQAYEEGFTLWQRAAQAGKGGRRMRLAARPLRVDWPYLPLTFDPALAGDIDTVGAIDQLFSGLVQLSPALDVLPDLAERWELLEEGRKYIFHLRRDARWSDNTPLTAPDFVFAWQRVLDPATQAPSAGLLGDIQSTAAPDDHTLVVELKQPASYFLYLMAYATAYPVPRHAVERLGAAWAEAADLISCGPFRIARNEDGRPAWDPDHLLVLERNPLYYGRFGGNLQRVELRQLENAEQRLAAYERGELDTFSFRGLKAERDLVRQRHAGEYLSVPNLTVTYAGFNLARPPFEDARLRRAFVLAVDRAAHANLELKGFAFPAVGGLIPPGMPGHTPGLALPFDPAEARRLLAECGFPEGRGLPPIEMLAGEGNESILTFLAAQWQQNLGVTVGWQMLDYDAFMARMQSPSPASAPHIFLNAWMPDYPDPDNFLRICDALTWTRYTLAQSQVLAVLPDLIDHARSLTDQPARLEMYRRADSLLVDQAALLPFNYWRSHLLIKSSVKQFPTSAIKWWYWCDVVIGE